MMNNNKILGSNKKSPKRLPQQSNKISSWLNKSDEQRKEVCNNSIHIKKEKSDLKIGDNYDRELVATNNNINHKASTTKQKSYVLVEGPWLSKEGKIKRHKYNKKNKDLKEPLKLEHKHSNPCSDQRLVGGQVCKTPEKQSSGDGYLQISPRNKVTLSASPTRNIASEFENTNSAKHTEKQTTPVKERVNIHPTLRRSPRTQKSKQLGSSPEINIGTDKIKSLYRETTPIRQKCEVSARSPRNLGLPKSSPTGTAKRLFKNIEDSHSNTLNTRLDKNAMKGERESVGESIGHDLGCSSSKQDNNKEEKFLKTKKPKRKLEESTDFLKVESLLDGNYKDRKENNIRGDWRKDKISAEEKHKKESKLNKTSSIKTKEKSSYHDRDKTFKRIDNDYKSEGEVPSKKRIKLDRTMNKKEIKETKEKRDELRKNKHYSKSHVHTEEPSSKTSESKSISQKKKKSHTKWIEPKTEDKAETKTDECEKNKKDVNDLNTRRYDKGEKKRQCNKSVNTRSEKKKKTKYKTENGVNSKSSKQEKLDDFIKKKPGTKSMQFSKSNSNENCDLPSYRTSTKKSKHGNTSESFKKYGVTLPSIEEIHKDQKDLEKYKNQIEAFQDIDLEYFRLPFSIYDLSKPQENSIDILDCKNLTLDEVTEAFKNNLNYISDIFHGKTYSERHDKFFSNRNKAASLSTKDLTYSTSVIVFSFEQKEHMISLLKDEFDPKDEWTQYFFQVLLPELCLKIFMDTHNMTRDAAVKYLDVRPIVDD